MTNTFTNRTIIIPHWAVEGVEISAEFGRINPKLWPHPWGHPGVDFKTLMKTPYKAIFSGTVELAGYDYHFGHRIWIKTPHPTYGHIRTLYAHSFQLNVKKDDIVTAGQVIGLTGNSGMTRQGKRVPPHLHTQFEVSPTRELLRPIHISEALIV